MTVEALSAQIVGGTVPAVPEASTVSMMLAGVGLLAALGRKARHGSQRR